MDLRYTFSVSNLMRLDEIRWEPDVEIRLFFFFRLWYDVCLGIG